MQSDSPMILLAISSLHAGAWRYPGAIPDFNRSFPHLRQLAQWLEHSCFHGLFLPDSLAVRAAPMASLSGNPSVVTLDPLTLLPALAAVTGRLGLIGTASTTYHDPYLLARRLATLDLISHGRAGWNLVTSSNPNEAANFGRPSHLEHDARYDRADEFTQVMQGLWDSWDADAFCMDTRDGRYFDPAKLHVLNHQGPHFSVRGPLNVARPVQGRPVIVQAGASEAGKRIAARWAELVFTYQLDPDSARAFRREMRARAASLGRRPPKILPAALVVVGDSLADARRKRAQLDAGVDDASSLATLSIALGHDISGCDPHAPLPPIPPSNASVSGRERVVQIAAREQLSVLELARRICGYQGLELLGSPSMIADQMQDWLEAEAADGFNIMFSHLPGGAVEFMEQVIPVLQRRGLAQRHYAGQTFRQNLGLDDALPDPA